jgi:adenylosuccinate synthase
LGISKAYTTRVGSGPFPTELVDATGDKIREKGHEFGSTTRRPRRCGWLDMVILKRAVELNSLTGLCITKLDVLDGFETLRIATGYRLAGQLLDFPPQNAEQLAACEPIYEDLPGWQASTAGITEWEKLPSEAQVYLKRVEALVGIPVAMVSTGPDRNETIFLQNF